MKLDLPELQKLSDNASPEPWVEDDGNIFSQPLSKLRQETIMKIVMGDKNLRHPDEGLDHPVGFVGNVPQFTQNFQEDLDLIVEARNALPELIKRVRELEAEKEAIKPVMDLAWHVAFPEDLSDRDGKDGSIQALKDALNRYERDKK